VYFAFITGLSIGYGDIAPTTGLGRVMSVAIGLTGMIFVGLSVAVSTRALADTVKHHVKDVS
ncbi:potassium channel family protein, partial [Pirellulales bacterium]|nr:potassium channel family protein [Pirellulales bacterium]